jgi:hypothetical protein
MSTKKRQRLPSGRKSTHAMKTRSRRPQDENHDENQEDENQEQVIQDEKPMGIPPQPEEKVEGVKMVWMGTTISDDDISAAEEFFLDRFGVRMKYQGTIVTLPGGPLQSGALQGDGGRHDAVFRLHAEDVPSFATQRFLMGNDCPRWWHDYLANNAGIFFFPLVA